MLDVRTSLFGRYAVTALDDEAAPPAPPLDAAIDGAGDARPRADLTYERPLARWAPIDPAEPVDGLPVRFVDGSIVSRLAGAITVEGRKRPLVAATIAAAALEMSDGVLLRCPGAITRSVLAVYEDDIDNADLRRADQALAAAGVTLLRRRMEKESGARDFDTLRLSTRNRAMDEMEFAERDVLLQTPDTPTLVDGLLERRLVHVPDRAIPAVGLVKQHAAVYLPEDLQEMLYRLRPGQRSPAFVMEVDNVPLVNLYLRLSALPGASPSGGVVRVTAPLAFVDRLAAPARWRYLSALAGYLHRLRHRDEGYARAAVSIEPIVRVEEHLRAIRPDIDTLVRRLHRLFRAAAPVGRQHAEVLA